MTKKRSFGTKRCVHCLSVFKGSIDPDGLFCSSKCWAVDSADPERQLKRQKEAELRLAQQQVNYPFFCTNCNKPVVQTVSTSHRKSHKKGFCSKTCMTFHKNKLNPKKKQTSPKKPQAPISFYESREWLELRYRVLKKYGRKCMLCGETKGQIHIDHIKPRSKHPHLSLVESNLQVLCQACNLGKGNWDETDWRRTFRNLFSDLF